MPGISSLASPYCSKPLRPAALAVLAAALLAGALLGACGGTSPNQNAASNEQANEAKLAEFARCMREHGFEAEVASAPTGGRAVKIRPGKATGGPGASELAQKACAHYESGSQTASLSPQQKVESEEAVQRFAKCMRERGIKLEASAKGGAISIVAHYHPGSGEPNPESPAFQRAQTACQKLLPRGGGPKG